MHQVAGLPLPVATRACDFSHSYLRVESLSSWLNGRASANPCSDTRGTPSCAPNGTGHVLHLEEQANKTRLFKRQKDDCEGTNNC